MEHAWAMKGDTMGHPIEDMIWQWTGIYWDTFCVWWKTCLSVYSSVAGIQMESSSFSSELQMLISPSSLGQIRRSYTYFIQNFIYFILIVYFSQLHHCFAKKIIYQGCLLVVVVIGEQLLLPPNFSAFFGGTKVNPSFPRLLTCLERCWNAWWGWLYLVNCEFDGGKVVKKSAEIGHGTGVFSDQFLYRGVFWSIFPTIHHYFAVFFTNILWNYWVTGWEWFSALKTWVWHEISRISSEHCRKALSAFFGRIRHSIRRFARGFGVVLPAVGFLSL